MEVEGHGMVFDKLQDGVFCDAPRVVWSVSAAVLDLEFAVVDPSLNGVG